MIETVLTIFFWLAAAIAAFVGVLLIGGFCAVLVIDAMSRREREAERDDTYDYWGL